MYVYALMERVEQITRSILNVRRIKPSENLHSAIVEEVLDDPSILEMWEANATVIPVKYETYSIELLKAVVELWATVRCFSFAAGCNIPLEKAAAKKQGTRRTLKTRGTEKES